VNAPARAAVLQLRWSGHVQSKTPPEKWEPVFAISSESRVSPRTLYDIAAAFSGNEPVRFFLSGLWRALKTEIKWLKVSLAKKFRK